VRPHGTTVAEGGSKVSRGCPVIAPTYAMVPVIKTVGYVAAAGEAVGVATNTDASSAAANAPSTTAANPGTGGIARRGRSAGDAWSLFRLSAMSRWGPGGSPVDARSRSSTWSGREAQGLSRLSRKVASSRGRGSPGGGRYIGRRSGPVHNGAVVRVVAHTGGGPAVSMGQDLPRGSRSRVRLTQASLHRPRRQRCPIRKTSSRVYGAKPSLELGLCHKNNSSAW